MATFSRRVILLLLVVVVGTSIALRYPLVEHERFQTDSYTIHFYSKAIVDDGFAVWTFHPLSYFGYYPFSYPSGMPFVLSELSLTTGLSLELSILVTGIAFGICFSLTAFILCRQFIRRPEYSLLAALLVTLGPRFVDTTYWNASARGPLVVIMTLAVFVFFRYASNRQRSLLLVGSLLVLCCLSLHHMAVLISVFVLGYMGAVFGASILSRRFPVRKGYGSILTVYTIGLGISIVLVAFLTIDHFRWIAEMNLRRSSWFDLSPPILSILVNAVAAYVNQIGFVVAFAVAGIPAVMGLRWHTTASIFPIMVIIFFIPMFGQHLYLSMLLLPFAAVLGTMWISKSIRRWRRVLVLAISGLVIASFALPIWSVDRWNSVEQTSGDTVEVGSQVFNDATYMRVHARDITALSNSYVLSWQLLANTDTKFLGSGMILVLEGYMNSEDVKENVAFSDARFPVNLYRWFEYSGGVEVDSLIFTLMIRGISVMHDSSSVSAEMKDFFSGNPLVLVAVDNNWNHQYVHVYGSLNSRFLEQVSDAIWMPPYDDEVRPFSSYVMYSSEKTSMYLVELPI